MVIQELDRAQRDLDIVLQAHHTREQKEQKRQTRGGAGSFMRGFGFGFGFGFGLSSREVAERRAQAAEAAALASLADSLRATHREMANLRQETMATAKVRAEKAAAAVEVEVEAAAVEVEAAAVVETQEAGGQGAEGQADDMQRVGGGGVVGRSNIDAFRAEVPMGDTITNTNVATEDDNGVGKHRGGADGVVLRASVGGSVGTSVSGKIGGTSRFSRDFGNALRSTT